MEHKKIIEVTVLCYGTNVCTFEEHRSQTCAWINREINKLKSRVNFSVHEIFKTSPGFPWLLTVMCQPSLQDDIALSCCGISQHLRFPPDVLINAVIMLMLVRPIRCSYEVGPIEGCSAVIGSDRYATVSGVTLINNSVKRSRANHKPCVTPDTS